MVSDSQKKTAEKQSAEKQSGSSKIKIGATVLIFGAIALYIWHLIAPLPSFLEPVYSFTQVILFIHAIEGAIAAVLIARYKLQTANTPDASSVNSLLVEKLPDNSLLAVIKAGLYAFFVGTVGLVEIIEATKPRATTSTDNN